MANLPLNPRAARHSHALGDQKQARLGRIHFLVANHTVRETVIVHQQASGAKFSIAKCIKRATTHDITGNMSIRGRQAYILCLIDHQEPSLATST